MDGGKAGGKEEGEGGKGKGTRERGEGGEEGCGGENDDVGRAKSMAAGQHSVGIGGDGRVGSGWGGTKGG